MTRACVTAWAVVVLLSGCGRTPLPKNATVPKDRAELEVRYDVLRPGVTGPDVAAFMGKPGAALAGYSTVSVRRRPDDAEGVVAAGDTHQYWASADGSSAVHVVFGDDGRARLVELLTITPMGPPPAPPPTPAMPDPPAP